MNDELIFAYLPNTGSLQELLLPKRLIYLEEFKKGRYKVCGVEKEGNIICLDTSYINKVVKVLIKERNIFGFKPINIIEEFKLENHRIDFLIKSENKSLLLEVKSSTLFYDEIAMFPDAVTLRGSRHLDILNRNRGGIIFVILSPSVKFFLPNFHNDSIFSEKLYESRSNLIIKAIVLNFLDTKKFEFVREAEIPWDVYEKECEDRGSYILLGYLYKSALINIGGLGKKFFKKGFYTYIGSGMKGLNARCKRHLKKIKNLRWHIDYLTPYLQNKKIFPIRSSEKLECNISNDIEKISNGFIESFGSSDCRCKSHIYFFNDNPLHSEGFFDILLKYRIGRLRKMINYVV